MGMKCDVTGELGTGEHGTGEHDTGENIWTWGEGSNKRSFVIGAVHQISWQSNQ